MTKSKVWSPDDSKAIFSMPELEKSLHAKMAYMQLFLFEQKLLLSDFVSKPLFKVGSLKNGWLLFCGNSEIMVDRYLIN